MGEAKRRGGFEQRKAEAIEREKQEARNRIGIWKPGTPRSKASLAASAALALALSSLNKGL